MASKRIQPWINISRVHNRLKLIISNPKHYCQFDGFQNCPFHQYDKMKRPKMDPTRLLTYRSSKDNGKCLWEQKQHNNLKYMFSTQIVNVYLVKMYQRCRMLEYLQK
ncbi:hypothetical protein RF11_00898 [Thelohanellus kitauei]|uniref:Uncharacterized protein n=1 Tax=Thelohanellus kitauei TaxID=669202 RepID=A0A0C2NAF3_THEKT|nr:hypothetical protein RF11_00898 [Thelohanellus kitauei]